MGPITLLIWIITLAFLVAALEVLSQHQTHAIQPAHTYLIIVLCIVLLLAMAPYHIAMSRITELSALHHVHQVCIN